MMYDIAANCDPSPLENDEAKAVNPIWEFLVKETIPISPPGNIHVPIVSSFFGTGNTRQVGISSPNAGTWKIEFEAAVTYDVWDKVNDELMEGEKFGPFKGTASCTFKATDGGFRIILIPDDDCKETPDNKRSVTRFGIGETGKIKVEPIEPNTTVTVMQVACQDEDICIAAKEDSGGNFTFRQKPGSATIAVLAIAGGIDTVETYDVTAIVPTGMFAIDKENWRDGQDDETDEDKEKRNEIGDRSNISGVGSGMRITMRFEPKDVSFANSVLGEGKTTGKYTKNVAPLPQEVTHPANIWKLGPGDVEKGSLLSTYDRGINHTKPLDFPDTSYTWNIPFGYYEKRVTSAGPTEIMNNPQIPTFDGKGGCSITKFGMSATRVPKNLANFLDALDIHSLNHLYYVDGWKYID